MATELEKEIEKIYTYVCPVHGEFTQVAEGFTKTMKCPTCQRPSKRTRISMREKSIAAYVFTHLNHYVRDKVHKPLEKAVIMIAGRLDFEPKKENTKHNITHVLIDIEGKFFRFYKLKYKRMLFHSALKLLKYKAETDRHYRSMFRFFIEELVKEALRGNLKLRKPNEVEWEYWDEPMENFNELQDMLDRLFEVGGRI